MQGDYIGVDVTGKVALPNLQDGINSDALTTTIGGTTAGALNIISGNFGDGITLFNTALLASAVVQGNDIGVDVTGTTALGNAKDGVNSDTTNTTIGGTVAADINLISGNGGNGVTIGSGVNQAVVQGNYVGVNAAGTKLLGNKGDGVRSYSAATTIGGTAAGALNLISGNSGNGITLINTAAGSIAVVLGNIIGLDVTGKVALPNSEDGITSDVATTTIGGTTTGALNLISGNLGNGIRLLNIPTPSGSTALVQGNIIGLDVTGMNPLGNAEDGVNSDAATTTIGGPDPNAGLLTTGNAGNLISDNRGNGITIGGDVTMALVQGNYVGLNGAGTAPGQQGRRRAELCPRHNDRRNERRCAQSHLRQLRQWDHLAHQRRLHELDSRLTDRGQLDRPRRDRGSPWGTRKTV